jgi:hypothetical protein
MPTSLKASVVRSSRQGRDLVVAARRRLSSLVVRALLIAALPILAGGCRQIETRFDVLSFHNPDQPEQFTERFQVGSFSVDAQNNWDIVFEIPASRIEVQRPLYSTSSPASQPADEASRPVKTETTPMSQYVHIQVFWRPLPGTTYAESSQTNASILYCLITGNDAISYEGAGFVYFTQSYDKQTITGQIESATLVPVRTVGEPVDLFGPCRLQGFFVAHQDRRRVVSILQRLRKSLGRPVVQPGGSSQPPG